MIITLLLGTAACHVTLIAGVLDALKLQCAQGDSL